jgi:hypothetical protein
MPSKWHVAQKDNICTITREDGLIRYAVRRSKLQEQLAPYGIVGDTFKDVCEQLDSTDNVTVLAPEMGKYFQR